MPMIEYVEPVNVGSFFVGIGSLIMACVLAYIFYRFYVKICQLLDIFINKEAKYELLEESFMDKIATKKGINLEKELMKRQMLHKRTRSFRKQLEAEIYEEMFGKKKEE